MPVVPIRKTPLPTPNGSAPPDPQFALMAAAQMHSEGRLISAKADSTKPKAELNASVSG